MAILCRLHDAYGPALLDGIRAALPQEEIRVWPDVGDPDEIDVCIVFRMPPGFLAPFRNLKLISATGAGIDHFLLDPALPRHVPLVRVIDAEFAARMADYVLCWVLFHHREVARYLAAQQERRWAYRPMRSAHAVSVGVMGLGQMGRTACERLAGLGYQVSAWARRQHAVPGVACHAGPEDFPAFLAGTEILVNLLALTPATAGILRRATFDQLPRGGVLISAARGGHLVEADLLEALRIGQLRAATVDAFPTEPLPADSPLWTQPGLYVTPHCSSTASLETAVNGFADNVRRLRQGLPLRNRVDLDAGY